jgi:membrane protease YdiL (CAAX protease family)
MLLAEVGVLLAAVFPSLALAVVERRAWGAYGLPGRMAFGKMFWVGALWGFGSVSLLLAALYGARVLSVGELALHGLRAAKFAVFWAGFFLIVGWYEEFLLRGYTQFTLTRLIGFWPAAVVLSCVFSLIHLGNAGEQWPGWIFLLSYFEKNREFVVCGGFSRGLGLGGDFYLFGAG